MEVSLKLIAVAVVVLLVNVPFGFWRAGTRKFSLRWFAAVHVPVPLVILVRLLAGVEWRWTRLPLLAAAYFAGQLLGSKFRTGNRS
ncbi:MAG: hypothetical protein JSV80_03125 [Acidobacteriota bacterium]|nr:MAG: hypothetical protein JSV80_03125 [Acidobacteriota bacterium]